MRTMLVNARIEADLTVVATDNTLSTMQNLLNPTAVLFAGFEPPDETANTTTLAALEPIANLPCDVLFVHSAGDASVEA